MSAPMCPLRLPHRGAGDPAAPEPECPAATTEEEADRASGFSATLRVRCLRARPATEGLQPGHARLRRSRCMGGVTVYF